jgi:hypothetical protein
MPRPIPRLPPVTNATLFRSNILLLAKYQPTFTASLGYIKQPEREQTNF